MNEIDLSYFDLLSYQEHLLSGPVCTYKTSHNLSQALLSTRIWTVQNKWKSIARNSNDGTHGTDTVFLRTAHFIENSGHRSTLWTLNWWTDTNNTDPDKARTQHSCSISLHVIEICYNGTWIQSILFNKLLNQHERHDYRVVTNILPLLFWATNTLDGKTRLS